MNTSVSNRRNIKVEYFPQLFPKEIEDALDDLQTWEDQSFAWSLQCSFSVLVSLWVHNAIDVVYMTSALRSKDLKSRNFEMTSHQLNPFYQVFSVCLQNLIFDFQALSSVIHRCYCSYMKSNLHNLIHLLFAQNFSCQMSLANEQDSQLYGIKWNECHRKDLSVHMLLQLRANKYKFSCTNNLSWTLLLSSLNHLNSKSSVELTICISTRDWGSSKVSSLESRLNLLVPSWMKLFKF